MLPGPRQVPLSPHPDAELRRLNIHGIDDMPAGYDAEVAELCRDLRAATALSEMDLAARLGTRADVVQALEQGAIYALPPWTETSRVVKAYGGLLNLDVQPLLRRIYAQIEAGIVELQPRHMPEVPTMTPPSEPDYSYAPSNAGGASPNPLDIPWPPPSQAPQPQPRGNAWAQPQPGVQPQAPWQNPQAQPQNTWQNAPQQAWPGQPAPQSPPRPQPQAQPQRQAAPQMQPQPQPADRRPPQPRAPQPPAPPQARPQPAPPLRPAPPPEPHPLDADFGIDPAPAVEAATLEPEQPEKAKRRPLLLKLGLGALVISIVGFGLWFALTHAQPPAGTTGVGAPSGTMDPDDPRSRKADKLPSPPGG
jgi:hypothetical protein